MKKVMVRYKVKKDHVAENEKLIHAVFNALAALAPTGFHYASLKLDDGVSFVHLVSFETPDDDNPLSRLPEFAAFTANLRDRCDEPPVFSPMTVVGQYGKFPA